jgi:hypothetical protein
MPRSRSRSRSACGPGKIRRSAYSRRSYTRKSRSRKGSVRVRASSVRSSCVPDVGQPGKTPKSQRVLPKVKGQHMLRQFGYSTANSSATRQKALRAAIRNYGALEVLRHLNLIRNYQPYMNAKNAMSEDVAYLSRSYRRSSSRKRSRK